MPAAAVAAARSSKLKQSSFFLVLCGIGFAGFFGSYLRIPVLPLLVAEVGGGPAQVGMVNSAFMVSAGLLSIPAGMLADALGRRRTVIIGLAAMAASSFAVAASSSVGQMACSYVFFGAGIAAFAPSMMSFVAESTPSGALARAYGWYTTAVYTAMTIGPATGGFLAGQAGLRNVFLTSAVCVLAVAVAAAVMLDGGTIVTAHPRGTILGKSALLVRNRRLVAVLVATLGSCVGFGAFLTFLPLYAHHSGFAPGTIGLILGCQSLINVVARVPLGKFIDRLPDKGIAVIAGFLVLAAGVAFLGTTTGFGSLSGCAALIGIGMAVGYPAVGALIAEAVSADYRGLAMGMYNSCIYLGMTAGAAFLGLVAEASGYPAAFVTGAAVTALSAIVFFFIFPKKSFLNC